MRSVISLSLTLLAIPLSATAVCAETFKAFPAGVTHLEVESHVDVVFREEPPDPTKPCSDPTNQPCETLVLRGTLTVIRYDPERADEDGRFQIRQEVIAGKTRGTSQALGKEITLRQSGERRTFGLTEQEAAGTDFPGTSTFEVFVEISVLGDDIWPTVFNVEPIRVSGTINQIPPVGAGFVHAADVATPLQDKDGSKLTARAEYDDASVPQHYERRSL